ncbi:MAG: energy transducer TonB [Saprospiraceae bacterium]
MKIVKSSIKLILILNIISLLFIFSCKKESEKIEIKEPEIEELTTCLAEIDGTFQEVILDENPEYLDGGFNGLIFNLISTIVYPAEARENGIEGFSSANFDITEEGKVENVEIIENPGGGIGEELKTTIEEITSGISFSPGILNGNPIKVQKTLVATFKLQG